MLSKLFNQLTAGVAASMLWASRLVGKVLKPSRDLQEATSDLEPEYKVYHINRKRRRVLASCMRRRNGFMKNIKQHHIPHELRLHDLEYMCARAGISPKELLSHA